MSPEERNLIVNLFDRIRDAGAIDKDRQAETLIRDAVRQLPDAPYVLVQSVLLQENALAEAQARIEELEARVADFEAERQPQTSRSGGFLGGARPLSRGAGSSVPSVGATNESPSTGVWGRTRADSPDVTPASSSRGPTYQPAMPPMPQAPAASSGGGFFRSALAAAAGVAGGVMLSDSLKGMMGGGAAGHNQASHEPHYQSPNDNDPGQSRTASATPQEFDSQPIDDDTSWADDSMDA